MSLPIPVTLITGFLGSGKTTLLSKLLARPGLEGTAVIINEFGEVPLDQALIESRSGNVVVLAGGCLCCAMQGDVASTLKALYARRASRPFDRVLIEASGLADPAPILAPLVQDRELTALFRLEGVIATIDALQGERELGRQRVAAKQIAVADRILLTKSDIAAPRAVTRLQELLTQLNPWASLLSANHGDVDPDWLLGRRPPPPSLPAASPDPDHDHHHDHGIRAFCLWLDGPIDWENLAQSLGNLAEEHGERLLRIKGVVYLNEHSQPVAVHGVQHFLHPPTPLTGGVDEDRRSRLVFITDRLPENDVRPFLTPLAKTL